MKKIILFAFIALHLTASAQFTLLHSFSDWFSWDNDTKIYYPSKTRLSGDTIFLYNWDFSLYKEIVTTPPNGYKLEKISLLGRRYLNNDDSIEMCVFYQEITSDAFLENNQILHIINDNGTLINDFGSAYGWDYYGLYTNNNETRISFLKYFYTHTNTVVYSCTGSGQASIPSVEEQNSFLGNAYPNPSNRTITIPYSLTSSKSSVIHIYGTNGTLIKTIPVGPHFNEVMVDVSAFPAGVYVYECEGKTNKFVVN